MEKYDFEKLNDWHYVWYVDDDELIDVYVVGETYILRHECDFNASSFKMNKDELEAYLDETFGYLDLD